jgi:phosphoserine phosphatase RsbU/P
LVPEAEYATAHVKLEPGDTLVLFSDGVTEAMDPQEELFGMPRLVKLLTGHNDTPLNDLQKVVLEAVENFAHGTSQADDLTLLLVRFRATTTAVETEFPRAHTSASAD